MATTTTTTMSMIDNSSGTVTVTDICGHIATFVKTDLIHSVTASLDPRATRKGVEILLKIFASVNSLQSVGDYTAADSSTGNTVSVCRVDPPSGPLFLDLIESSLPTLSEHMVDDLGALCDSILYPRECNTGRYGRSGTIESVFDRVAQNMPRSTSTINQTLMELVRLWSRIQIEDAPDRGSKTFDRNLHITANNSRRYVTLAFVELGTLLRTGAHDPVDYLAHEPVACLCTDSRDLHHIAPEPVDYLGPGVDRKTVVDGLLTAFMALCQPVPVSA